MEQTFDTLYVQLSFSETFYKEEDTLFRCDYVSAKDGGLPFLIILDVIKIGNRIFNDVPYGTRLEFIRLYLQDSEIFDVNNMNNEYRVRFPTLFSVDRIQEVFDFIIPNFYGNVYGVAFTHDSHVESKKIGDSGFLIKKSGLPEVYELFYDGLRPIPGNNIAYIPTLELSKKVRDYLKNRNSAKIQCLFDENRQKWIPNL